MTLRPRARLRRARGVSLIETLVGIAVGMIGILVIFQTVAVWDKHAQTTGAGSEVELTGTQAVFNLERDIKSAGYGFAKAASNVMGCSVEVKGNTSNFPLAPVRISSSPSGDVIDVLYGNSSHYVVAEEYTDATPSTKRLKRRGGFRAGDLIVVTGNATASAASARCVLAEITDASIADGVTISHATGSYTNFYTGAAASAAFNALSASGAPFTAGMLFNMGPSPRQHRWQVVNGVLQHTDRIHGTQPFAVAEGVVDVKAQYGVDTNADYRIADAEWTTALPADPTKILAIRVAILVRSQQFEKSGDGPAAAASAVAPSWFGTPFVMKNVDGTNDSYTATDAVPNNWRYYRYRVYERVIPLRNMIWGTL
jgi:type IV pilus assembly protein PilW